MKVGENASGWIRCALPTAALATGVAYWMGTAMKANRWFATGGVICLAPVALGHFIGPKTIEHRILAVRGTEPYVGRLYETAVCFASGAFLTAVGYGTARLMGDRLGFRRLIAFDAGAIASATGLGLGGLALRGLVDCEN